MFVLYGIRLILIFAEHPWGVFSEPLWYRAAAEAWVNGGDPWRVEVHGIRFGGTPWTLVPYLVFVPLPPILAQLVVGGLCVGAALLAVRMLGLPAWWILFPPLSEAWTHGSFDALIPVLALSGAAPLATFVKPYAAVLLRPRQVAVLVLLLIATAPFLPLGTYIANLDLIRETFEIQSASLSVWGNPVAMLAAGVAIIATLPASLPLAIPALWPYAQLHYGVVAMPLAARSRVLALGLALPVPGLAAVATMVWAAARWRASISRR